MRDRPPRIGQKVKKFAFRTSGPFTIMKSGSARSSLHMFRGSILLVLLPIAWGACNFTTHSKTEILSHLTITGTTSCLVVSDCTCTSLTSDYGGAIYMKMGTADSVIEYTTFDQCYALRENGAKNAYVGRSTSAQTRQRSPAAVPEIAIQCRMGSILFCMAISATKRSMAHLFIVVRH
jgi:hypothetical protein